MVIPNDKYERMLKPPTMWVPHVFRKTVLDSTSMTQNLFCGGSSGAELFKFISLVLEKVYQFSFGPCVAFLPRDTHHSELVPPHLWGATHEGIWK